MPFLDEQNNQTARNSIGGLTHVVLDFNALRLLAPFEQEGTCLVVYGTTFQDGLGGVFVWNPTDASADNGATVITPRSLPATGRWNLWLASSGSGTGGSVSPGAGILGVIDSIPLAAVTTVVWEVQAVKGTTSWAHQTVASKGDGVTPTNVDSGITMNPGNGTFDFIYAVDISGGLLRLTVTPTTGGWTFTSRRLAQMP